MQLQISTNSTNNFSIGPVASPSPNSRNTAFIAPPTKGRINGPSQSPTSFHMHNLPSRPVSVQIPRGKQLQPLNSPFSPQAHTPLSPLDQGFPSSPANQNIETFSRPSSENSQPDIYIQHSPQNRAFGHQSPIQASNRSPAYAPQAQGNQTHSMGQPSNKMNVDGSYNQAPGTPRPQYGSNTNRPTVYARQPEIFTSQASPFTSPRNDMFTSPKQTSPSHSGQTPNQLEGNRQLRDLLQRQQPPTSNSITIGSHNQIITQNTPASPSSRWTGNESDESGNSQQTSMQTSDINTFRQPLPPGMVLRPQRMPLQTSGGAIIRSNQILASNQGMNIPRMVCPQGQRIIRPAGKLIQSNQIITHSKPGQSQQFLLQGNQKLPINITAINRSISSDQHQQQQSFNAQVQQNPQLMQHNLISEQQNSTSFINQRIQRLEMENKEQNNRFANVIGSNSGQVQPTVNTDTESNEIPDNVTAELEKLEQEENSGIGEVEGVGDILGGLAEDDDDLLGNLDIINKISNLFSILILDSLTAEMDFNLLEYADPELDTLNDGEKANLLDSLELDEHGDTERDNKKRDNTSKNRYELKVAVKMLISILSI